MKEKVKGFLTANEGRIKECGLIILIGIGIASLHLNGKKQGAEAVANGVIDAGDMDAAAKAAEKANIHKQLWSGKYKK
jgi:hypothetical protein